MNQNIKHSNKFNSLVESVKKGVNEVTIEQVRTKLADNQPFILVDVREDSEWAAGHIPNAVHIGKGVIERDIEKIIPDTDAEIILYCGGGSRSALAAENVQKMGYRNVHSMIGGYRGWMTSTN